MRRGLDAGPVSGISICCCELSRFALSARTAAFVSFDTRRVKYKFDTCLNQTVILLQTMGAHVGRSHSLPPVV